MHRTRFQRTSLAALSALTLTGGLVTHAAAAPSPTGAAHQTKHSCSAPTDGDAICHAMVRVEPYATSPAAGSFGPADLQAAYNLPSATAGGPTQIIAIVDAYDAATAKPDLDVYRSTYGLAALPSCAAAIKTSATACFKKVGQTGSTTKLPRRNGGWGQEISLDLDMASAICPRCSILLVEATSASFANLGASVNMAVSLGATVVSNSYGSTGDAPDSTYGKYYNHPGVAITASSGDNGYGASYPASSRYVVAVGGTHLVRDGSTRGWTETAWSGAGSGCSTYNVKPTWQVDAGCARRSVADVSAVADPATGVAVYDSTAYQGLSGWMVFGGTSVAAPVIAGVYALAGNASTTAYPASLAYASTAALNDVVGGNNGSCSAAYLCTAVAGYDGPTGLGSPNGTGAF